MSLKDNNKGLSLVELLIAVAILAMIAAPLLSSFVFATRTAARSREIGDITLAAENMTEQFLAQNYEMWTGGNLLAPPTIEGIPGALYLNFNYSGTDNFFQMPNPISFSVEDYQDIYFGYQNVTIGDNEFDILVTLDPGEPPSGSSSGTLGSGYWNINSVPMLNYIPTNYSFDQTTSNPDDFAWQEFIAAATTKGINTTSFDINDSRINAKRTITLTVDDGTVTGDNMLHASVKYSYEFTYPGTVETFTSSAQEYEITPTGGVDASKEDAATFYIMFFPWYYGGSSVRDTIVINKPVDNEINVVLVKKLNPALSAAEVTAGETSYKASVYFMQKYNPDLYDSATNSIEVHGSLLTNINEPLDPGVMYPLNNVYYFISNGSGTYTRTELDSDNDIAVAEITKRVYDITIDVYEADGANFNGNPGEPIYSINTSSLQ